MDGGRSRGRRPSLDRKGVTGGNLRTNHSCLYIIESENLSESVAEGHHDLMLAHVKLPATESVGDVGVIRRYVEGIDASRLVLILISHVGIERAPAVAYTACPAVDA